MFEILDATIRTIVNFLTVEMEIAQAKNTLKKSTQNEHILLLSESKELDYHQISPFLTVVLLQRTILEANVHFQPLQVSPTAPS